MKRALLLCLFLLPTVMASAAGVYRWVDENGTVHYTQTPPPKADRVGDVESVSTSVGVYSPRRRDGALYCGSRRVPLDPVYPEAEALYRLKEYREQQKERFQRSSSSGGSVNAQSVEEQRCLLGWADSQWREHEPTLAELRRELQDLERRHQALLRSKQRGCPSDAGMLFGEDARKWAACNRELNPDLRATSARMQTLRRLFDQ